TICENLGVESPLGGALARAWPPAPPPKAVATIPGYHLGRAIPHSPPTESHSVKMRSETTPVEHEAPPPRWCNNPSCSIISLDEESWLRPTRLE
ncbi:MAG: hypothetical protein ACKPKO_00180, partial [Candidatus Fonsibacter sp.]